MPTYINFPTFTTPLIGRDADVAAIVARLRDSSHQFASLVGTSGTGKTRLSMQIATAMEADFPDGMAFIPLASITNPALVIPTIARTLGIAETSFDTFWVSLANHIGTQSMLLVLDNFEQVVAAAPAVAELLSKIPNTRVLCTSQIPTQLTDEELIAIPPLALPETTDSLETLAASPAVALFVERIRHVQPHFALTKQNASAVSELCRRLRGLPLAIELVATHSERLQPDDLLLLLRAYLPQERHRRDALSPEEVIFPVLSWCVAYGSPSIRWLLPRLGALWGEWREDQAIKIVRDPNSNAPVSATLRQMVNKGLLLSMESQTEEPTFTMLDVIRQFAIRRLRTDVKLASTMYARHAEVFTEQLQAIEAGMRSGEAARFGPIFAAAMPNIRAALQWFLDQEQYTEAVNLVSVLAFPSYQKGYLREALEWVDRTAPFINQTPPLSQMTWYYAQQLIAVMLADYERALESSSHGIPLARQLDEKLYLLRMLSNQALSLQLRGRYLEAREIYEEILKDLEVPLLRATVLNNLGNVSLELKDLDTALDYFNQSLTIREAANEEFGIGMSLHNLGDVYRHKQEYSKAEELFRKSLDFLKISTRSVVYAGSLMHLGTVIMKQHPDGDPPAEVQSLMRMGIKTMWELGAKRDLLFSFEAYAGLLTRMGKFREAAQLIGTADQIRQDLNVIPDAAYFTEVGETRALLDAAIGKRARRNAEKRGATRSIATTIEQIEIW